MGRRPSFRLIFICCLVLALPSAPEPVADGHSGVATAARNPGGTLQDGTVDYVNKVGKRMLRRGRAAAGAAALQCMSPGSLTKSHPLPGWADPCPRAKTESEPGLTWRCAHRQWDWLAVHTPPSSKGEEAVRAGSGAALAQHPHQLPSLCHSPTARAQLACAAPTPRLLAPPARRPLQVL